MASSFVVSIFVYCSRSAVITCGRNGIGNNAFLFYFIFVKCHENSSEEDNIDYYYFFFCCLLIVLFACFLISIATRFVDTRIIIRSLPMVVGSLLLSLLSEDHPRGRRRADPSWKASSRSSLRGTNLSREQERQTTCGSRPRQGRRYFPYSTQSNFIVGAAPALHSAAAVTEGSSSSPTSRHSSLPDQLGMNMTGKHERTPSPRHKAYVRPPSVGRIEAAVVTSRAHVKDGQVEHLRMGSLVPMRVERTAVEEYPSPVIRKPRRTGIRTFPPPSREKPVHHGVRMVCPMPGETSSLPYFVEPEHPRRNSHDNTSDSDSTVFQPHCKLVSLGCQKSHFSLAHSDAYIPPNYKRQLKYIENGSRSTSVDIITWRDSRPLPTKSEGREIAECMSAVNLPSTATKLIATTPRSDKKCDSSSNGSTPRRYLRCPSRINQSHFTLAYYSDKPSESPLSPPSILRRGKRAAQRCSSIDIIAWRGTVQSKDKLLSPQKVSRRSGSCAPPPRQYNIISGCPQ